MGEGFRRRLLRMVERRPPSLPGAFVAADDARVVAGSRNGGASPVAEEITS